MLPGRLTVSEVLEAVLPALPVERAALMDAEDGSRGPAARAALEKLLGTVPIDHVPRFDFYAATRSDRLCAPEPGPAPIVSKVCRRAAILSSELGSDSVICESSDAMDGSAWDRRAAAVDRAAEGRLMVRMPPDRGGR